MSKVVSAKKFLGDMVAVGVIVAVALGGAVLSVAIPLLLFGLFVAAIALPVLLLVRWVF